VGDGCRLAKDVGVKGEELPKNCVDAKDAAGVTELAVGVPAATTAGAADGDAADGDAATTFGVVKEGPPKLKFSLGC
jgi:hypothetical protein